MFFRSPWYKKGLQFECTQCGNCCKGPSPGHVWVNKSEITAIAEFLDMPEVKFTRRYVRRVGTYQLSLTEKRNHDCDFWSDDSGCQIYSVRPSQCRTFPFWDTVLKSRSEWDREARKCRGMNQGPTFSVDQIHAIRDNKADTRSYELDADDPDRQSESIEV